MLHLLVLCFFALLPQPDAQGNYLRNDGCAVASLPGSPFQAGCLWRVVALELNGRENPDLNSRVVRTFRRGTVLQADVGRGGSDEVLLNAVDIRGRTWMRVRSREGKDLNCWVRAHKSCLAPLP